MRKLKKLNIKELWHLGKLFSCSPNHLLWISHNRRRLYRSFEPTINGKKRPIDSPIGPLKKVQITAKNLFNRIELPDYLHGGIRHHSPKTNALIHVNKPAVLNFDIEDFFPSIHPAGVYNLFHEQLGCSPDVSRLLTRLITFKGRLPQGAPTSTTVANLIIVPLAFRLHKLAKCNKSDYSQFVDDGTISGPLWIGKLRPQIEKILKQENFRASPKPHKRTTRYKNEEQIVTGIKVNKQIDIPKEKVGAINNDLLKLEWAMTNQISFDMREIDSLRGKISHAKSLNQKKGLRLEKSLNQIIKSQ